MYTRPTQDAYVLNAQQLNTAFRTAVKLYTPRSSLALALLTPQTQEDAVYDAWALGRHDARYLLLLRRLLLELSPPATRKAIVALSHIGSHPDIFYTENNWISAGVRHQVLPAFKWHTDELLHMVSVIESEEWGRGTIGQSFDVILREDPGISEKLYAAVGICISAGKHDEALKLAGLIFSQSSSQGEELRQLLLQYPSLEQDVWFHDLAETIREFGWVDLY